MIPRFKERHDEQELHGAAGRNLGGSWISDSSDPAEHQKAGSV